MYPNLYPQNLTHGWANLVSGLVALSPETRQGGRPAQLFAMPCPLDRGTDARLIAEAAPSEKVGAALKPMPKRGRQPAVTDIAELRKRLAVVDDDFARPITRLALRLIALTAVRPGELRGAAWAEFDDLDGEAPLWSIPAARMKGGPRPQG